MNTFIEKYKHKFIFPIIIILFISFIVEEGHLDLTRTDEGIIIGKDVRVADVDGTPLSATFSIQTSKDIIEFVDDYDSYNLGDGILVEYKVPIIRFWTAPYIVKIK